ncbi:hypothetical protein [Methanorbis rubei]|uniref:Nucleotide-diphospho-sugar transferase n=1 Tax=Methanorbis rubei TaxID=3028300 RepID=A0AAE4SCA0_9EURY|nr:hypothetical protein [Methanocorpusculaceae archaeon Cs1]
MTETCFETPVLLLIFNRPDTTQQVFDRIRAARPTKLYVSADGPRDNKLSDSKLCADTRRILDQIDWSCELHVRFLDENVGCAKAISSGITWFFDHEEEGIILEDDCVPSHDFFGYCEILLQKYRDNPQVMMISGTNLISNTVQLNYSYDFSRWTWIWGWATWARSWKTYDITLSWWESLSDKIIHDSYFDEIPLFREHLLWHGDDFHATSTPDTWDYQWTYTVMMNNGLCIIPEKNLISNIGVVGAHYSGGDTSLLCREIQHLDVDHIHHPNCVCANRQLDVILFNVIMTNSLQYKIALTLGGMLRKICIFPRFHEIHPVIVGFFFKRLIGNK